MPTCLAACALVVQLVQSPPQPLAVPAALHSATSPTIQPQARPAELTSLYVSFAALQGLDVHSTVRALSSSGGREANPAMRWVVGNPAAMIAVKAAACGATIWMTEKMRRNHPRAAFLFMAALNTAMAAVVAHNYSVR